MRLEYWKDKSRKLTFVRAARVLSKSDRKKIYFVAIFQVFLGLLDLAGVVFIGILSSLAINGQTANVEGSKTRNFLSLFRIQDSEFKVQAIVLVLGAMILLLGRTALTVIFTRKMLRFLSIRGALITSKLMRHILSKPLLEIQQRTTQQTLFYITTGVEVLVFGVLAATVNIVSDLSLLIIITAGLFLVEPLIAFSIILLFVSLGLTLYRLMNVKAKELGMQSSKYSVASNEKILESFNSFREISVKNRQFFYADEVSKIRVKLAASLAEINFQPYISKYVIESALVVASLTVASIAFVLSDAVRAVTILSIFLAAGMRLAPAVLRAQQSSLTIRNSLGTANQTLEMLDEISDTELSPYVESKFDLAHTQFYPDVVLKDVFLRYPNSERFALAGCNLVIPAGTSMAIVGPTGAGKTSLIDVILGVIQPTSGEVSISSKSPSQAIIEWPGSIGYVPQDIVISNGSLRENVALGYRSELASNNLVLSALKVAQLEDFALTLPNGIDSNVGENGSLLSGGQRQRLGIARAMFTCPKLLVLDEATSALDGETEASISTAIQLLHGNTTVITIAHRLSTVRNSDQVAYIDQGKIIAVGTFDFVRKEVPDFDRQAKLMGL